MCITFRNMEVYKLQEEIKKGKKIIEYDNETIKYIQKPLGKALYLNAIDNNDSDHKNDNKKRKALWNDRIQCKICGKKMLRSNQSKHKKTQYHMAFEKMNNKIRDLLLK